MTVAEYIELLNAHRRTGLTPALVKARERLKYLLSLSPSQVERVFQLHQ